MSVVSYVNQVEDDSDGCSSDSGPKCESWHNAFFRVYEEPSNYNAAKHREIYENIIDDNHVNHTSSWDNITMELTKQMEKLNINSVDEETPGPSIKCENMPPIAPCRKLKVKCKKLKFSLPISEDIDDECSKTD